MPRIEISVLRWAPPAGRALVRDLRVRWALEEAGLRYAERFIGPEEQAGRRYRSLQPFGQTPAYMDDDVVLFEPGAIVLWVAEASQALLPADAAGRARVHAWLFAALNTVEPALRELAELDLFHLDEPWATARRPALLKLAGTRLADLSRVLEHKDYLEHHFTAADLMLASALQVTRHLPLIAGYPTLAAYLHRCEARPAYQRALAAQDSAYGRNSPDAAARS